MEGINAKHVCYLATSRIRYFGLYRQRTWHIYVTHRPFGSTFAGLDFPSLYEETDDGCPDRLGEARLWRNSLEILSWTKNDREIRSA